MKKIIALLLAVLMLLSLCACGNEKKSEISDDNSANSVVEEVKKAGLKISLKGVTNTITVKSNTGESEELIEYIGSGYNETEHPITSNYIYTPSAYSYSAWNGYFAFKEQPLDTEYTFSYEYNIRTGSMFIRNEHFYYNIYSIPSNFKIDLKGNLTLTNCKNGEGYSVNVAKLRSSDDNDIEYFFSFEADDTNNDISLTKISDYEYIISSTEPIKGLVIYPESGSDYIANEEKTSYKVTLDEYKEISVE